MTWALYSCKSTSKSARRVLTELEKKAVEIAKRYEKLPLQERIDVIARTFGCTTGKIAPGAAFPRTVRAAGPPVP